MGLFNFAGRLIESGEEIGAKSARQALQKKFVNAWKRTPELGEEINFVRFGKPVQNSTNYATGAAENGMSVYSTSKTGAAEQTIRSEFSDRPDAFVGKGIVSGYGSDGEPLVSGVSEIRKATPSALDKVEFYGMGKKKWLDALGYLPHVDDAVAHPITEEIARVKKYIPVAVGVAGIGAASASASAPSSGGSWSGKYTNGESFSGLSDDEMEKFQDHIDPASAREEHTPVDLELVKGKAGSVGYSGLAPDEQKALDAAYANSKAAIRGLSLETVRRTMDLMAKGYGARDIAAARAQDVDPATMTAEEALAPTSAANQDIQASKELLGQERGGFGSAAAAGLADVARIPGAAIGAGVHFLGGGLRGALTQVADNLHNRTDPMAGIVPAAWNDASESAQRAFANPTGMFGSPSSSIAFAGEIPLAAKALQFGGRLISGAMQSAPKLGSILAGAANEATASIAAAQMDRLGGESEGIAPSFALPALLGGAMGGTGGAIKTFALSRIPGVESYVEKAANRGTSSAAKERIRNNTRRYVEDVIDEANGHSWVGTGADIADVGQRANDLAASGYGRIDRAIAPKTTAFMDERPGNIVLHPDSPNYGYTAPPTQQALDLIRMNPEHLDQLAATPGLSGAVREHLLGHGVAAGEDLVWVPPASADADKFGRALHDLRSLSEDDPTHMFEGAHIAVRGTGPYKDLPAATASDLHKLAQRKVHADRRMGASTYNATVGDVDKALLAKFASAPTQYPTGATLYPSAGDAPLLWSDMSALRKSFNLMQGTKLRFGAANMQSDINRAGGDVVSKYMYRNNKSIADAGLQDVAQLSRMSYAKRKLVEGLLEEAAKTKLAKTFSEMAANELPASWRFATPMMMRRIGGHMESARAAPLTISLYNAMHESVQRDRN